MQLLELPRVHTRARGDQLPTNVPKGEILRPGWQHGLTFASTISSSLFPSHIHATSTSSPCHCLPSEHVCNESVANEEQTVLKPACVRVKFRPPCKRRPGCAKAGIRLLERAHRFVR